RGRRRAPTTIARTRGGTGCLGAWLVTLMGTAEGGSRRYLTRRGQGAQKNLGPPSGRAGSTGPSVVWRRLRVAPAAEVRDHAPPRNVPVARRLAHSGGRRDGPARAQAGRRRQRRADR